ncbi:MAG TPA: biopolymer transporter ExbD [Chitinophagaceae bacterium]
MTDITAAINEHRRAGVRRMKKHSLRTDMTPMVDLGFLLITFFVFTAKMSEPMVTHLNMPKESGIVMPVGESDALTVLLGKDNSVYYYEGNWEDALKNNAIRQSSLSYRNGLGDVIRQKQKELETNPRAREGKKGLMLIIKPGSEAVYRSVIDALDEVLINDVKKYVVVKPDTNEISWLAQH